MLLWVLRDDLGLTGTKFGCGEAAVRRLHRAGRTTRPVRACATPMRDVDGKRVVTIEGLARDGRLHPVQEAFVEHVGFQCGYCTPGMIMGAYALLLKNPQPTRAEIVARAWTTTSAAAARTSRIVAGRSRRAAAAMKGGAR